MESEDQKWMRLALSLAENAESQGEVPVGAVVVANSRLVATGYNLREASCQPTAHAELLAIEEAARRLGSWRLNGCTLYVTLEPCLMCAGAIYQSRIRTVIFGASDPKGGALESLYQIGADTRLNHVFTHRGSVLAKECGDILSRFFKSRRVKPVRQ